MTLIHLEKHILYLNNCTSGFPIQVNRSIIKMKSQLYCGVQPDFASHKHLGY